MRRALPLLLLAGCSSDGLLEIVVTPPAGVAVDEVELYVGIRGETIDSIRPAAGALARTVYWKRDANARDIQPMDADGVTYQFRVGGDEGEIASLIAVGFAARDGSAVTQPVAIAARLVWTDIPDDEHHLYTLELVPSTPLPREDPATDATPGVQVWGPADDPRACVQVDNVPDLVEHGNAPSAMIVDAGDIDCDGHDNTDEATECIANEYESQEPMTRDSLACVLPETFPVANTGMTVTGCVAGGSTCEDGPGESTCSPSSYCVPSALCPDCAGHLDCDLPQTATRVTCRLPTLFDEGTGKTEFCSSTHAVLELSNALGAVQCDLTLGAKLWARDNAFGDAVQFVNGPAFRLETSGADCRFEMAASGPLATTNANDAQLNYLTLIAAPLLKPVAGRGVMVPIIFQATPLSTGAGCPVAIECTFGPTQLADTGMQQCIRTPPAPGTVVVD